MPDFLLFRLEAPLMAMGDVAVGERRYGSDRPGKSAILGLVAAALGIDRSDEAAQAALAQGYGYAVRVEAAGRLIEDYHTAQVPAARKGRRWATRAAELAEPELETILSLRDYRADARHTVALWGREAAPHRLDTLARALERPHFILYVGRKACPLGRPPGPHLVTAASLAAAFAAFDAAMPEGAPETARVHADLEARAWLGQGLREDAVVRRRDAVASRRRWQFALRDELVAVPAEGSTP